MKKWKLAAVILAVIAAGSRAQEARASAEITILVPSEHISTSRSRVTVVGHTTASALRLFLNGELWGNLAVSDSMFHTSVRLPYGLNEIVVAAGEGELLSPENSRAELQVLYGPFIKREEGLLFPEHRFHSDEPPHACLRCHKGDQGDSAADGRWCYPCHNMVRQRLQEHIVDESRPCSGCHLISADLTAEPVRAPGGENPCFQCHQDKIGLAAQEFVHGPVAGGSCTVCHDPHGSEFANTLVSPVPVLCETCHGDVEGTERAVQHYPFEMGWCVECHDPHATNNRWVLLRDGQELCLGCHFADGSGDQHKHPYGVEPKREVARSVRLGADGKLECLSCHESHAADARFLLRTTEQNSCLGCHPEKRN